jgi:hypothetical protein
MRRKPKAEGWKGEINTASILFLGSTYPFSLPHPNPGKRLDFHH